MAALVGSVLTAASGADAAGPGMPDDCETAIARASRLEGVPSGLLRAMGVVESGRTDPNSGLLRPWPWSIHAAGQSWEFATKDQAARQIRMLQALGIDSIDVGCLQVNLHYHPDAFSSLDDALDPVANSDYAASFLSSLYRRDADWAIAAGHYHSETTVLAQDYEARVIAALSHLSAHRSAANTGSQGSQIFQRAAGVQRLTASQLRLRTVSVRSVGVIQPTVEKISPALVSAPIQIRRFGWTAEVTVAPDGLAVPPISFRRASR